MTNKPKTATRLKPEEAEDIMFSTFQPGRLYTHEDVRLRCKAKGWRFSEADVKTGLSKLMYSKRIECLKGRDGTTRRRGDLASIRIYHLPGYTE